MFFPRLSPVLGRWNWREYDKASTLTIYKAELRMHVDEVKTICGGKKSVSLNIVYDRIVFESSKVIALAIYPELEKTGIEMATKILREFYVKFAEDEYRRFEDYINSLGDGA